jgi:hypothetical protein
VGLAGVERLEDAGPALDGDAGAGVGDGEGDRAVSGRHVERQSAAAVHGLHAVEGDVPQHLDELVAVERERWQRRVDGDLDVDAGGARPVVADQPAHVLEDVADVAGRHPRLRRPGEPEEVGQDPIEPPSLGPHRGQRARALLGGQLRLVGQQGGRVDDGGQRVADLVSHARRQLTGGGQPLGLAQARLQALALAPGPLEDHDDHGERGQEVERDERGVHGEVGGSAGLDVHELHRDAVHAPQREQSRQQPLAPEARLAIPSGPEQHSRRHLYPAQSHADQVGRGSVTEVGHRGNEHGGRAAQQHVARGEPVVPTMRE